MRGESAGFPTDGAQFAHRKGAGENGVCFSFGGRVYLFVFGRRRIEFVRLGFFFVLFAEVGAEGSDLIVGSAAVRKFEGVGGRHKHEPKPLLGCSHLELINRQQLTSYPSFLGDTNSFMITT